MCIIQLDPSDTIKVAVRVRPLLEYEKAINLQEAIQLNPEDPTALKASFLAWEEG